MSDTRSSGTWAARVLAAGITAALAGLALDGGTFDVVSRGQAAVLVWWLILLLTVADVGRRRKLPLPLVPAVIALLALVGWMGVSLGWTASDERTWSEMARVAGYAGVLVLVGLIVAPPGWLTVASAIPVVVLGISILALFARLAPEVLSSDLAQTEYGGRRIAFPFNYWNSLGAWGAMGAALGLAWSSHAQHRWIRGLALSAVPVAVSVSYLAYSRTAVLAVGVAVVTVVVLGRNRWLTLVHAAAGALASFVVIRVIRSEEAIADATGSAGAAQVALAVLLAAVVLAAVPTVTSRLGLDRVRLSSRNARVGVLAGIAVFAVLAALAGPGLADRAWESFNKTTLVAGDDPAARLTSLGGARANLYRAAMDEFRASPLRGSGAGTFEFVWNRSPERLGESVQDAHSLYLEALAELGWPGALLLFSAIALLLGGILRARMRVELADEAGAIAGLGGAFVVFCVSAGADWMWESTSLTVTALTAAAIALSGGTARHIPLGLGRRAVLVVVAVVAMGLQISPIVSTEQARQSQRAVERGDLRQARVDADDSVAAEPWAAIGYLQRSLVLEQQGHLAAAAFDAQRAADREPHNWRHWLVLARVEAKRGRVPSAIRAARRAQRANPRSPIFRLDERGDR